MAAEKRSLDDLAAELRAAADRLTEGRDGPGKGIWRHRTSGGLYAAIDVSFRADMTVEVTYCPEMDYRVQFHRPIDEFLERFERVS